MKAQKLFLSILLTVFIFGITQKTFSQPANCHGDKAGKCCMNIPDLTDDQKGKIEKLHTGNMKAFMPMKNELKEKKAKMHTLMTAEKVDMVQIDKVIDEMGAIEVNIEKKHAAMVQEIRKILTEDQRLMFDMQSCKMREGMDKNCCPGGLKSGAGMHGKSNCKGMQQPANSEETPMHKDCPHGNK
ncbi:MAG: Spy/CpxP family protein refolding chaperone [Bacteroidota bacterium]